MARLNECILYRNFEHGEILDKMAELMNAWEQKEPDLKEKEGLFFECANGLVETAGAYGFSGNLWHCYLTFLLVNNENAFSTACEIRGAVNGSINELALNDFGVFKELYDFDLTVLDEAFGISCCKVLGDYTNTGSNSKMFNSRIRDRICDLSKTLAAAESTEEFMKDMVQFYKDFGVGKPGGIKGAKRGNEVVMVPNDYAYFDYYQSKDVDKEPFSIGGFVDVAKVYSLDPTEGLTAEEGKKIIGVQANLWAEYITTFSHAQYMLLPRMAALAEVAWTPQETREYSNFLNRAKLLTQRYEALGYNFAKHILQESKSNE